MVLAALLLICAVPQLDDNAKVANDTPAAVSDNAKVANDTHAVVSDNAAKDSTLMASAALPSAPTPKVTAAPEPIQPNPSAQPFQPIRPVITRPRETPRQRKLWYALTIASSSGAAFDAWSTRRAISGGYGTESNPFLRPFSHSNAMYAATQVSPAFMDFIGKRMMVSEYGLFRKMWWLPQLAGAGFSFGAAAHNVSIVH
jgi:hypothetical protein